MSNLELLDRAAASTTCQVLGAAGSTLVGVGVVGAVTGAPAMVPLTAGALSLLASNYLCPDMPMGGAPPVPPGVDGCQEMEENGYGQLQSFVFGAWRDEIAGSFGSRATKITEVAVSPYEPTQGGYASVVFFEFEGGNDLMGWTTEWFPTREQAASVKYRIDPRVGSCAREQGDPAPVPPEATETYEFTDESTNCTYNVTLQGFAQPVPDGPVNPVYLIEGTSTQRADGGRMGGCNFSPTIYMPDSGGGNGGGGGGGVYLPVPDGPSPTPPGPGVPWWAAPLLAGSIGAALNLIGQELGKLSEADFEEGSFTMTAPCDVDENGEPEYRTWEFQEGSFEQRMNAHQVALMEMLQQHLNWKTPTCNCNEKPKLEGTWISTRWISDGNSPGGERPLRKLFRYRSKSALTDEQLREYWADFTWQAGPVCVIHKGAWWGTPQVWTSTPEEGQRVLRFAGAEAGLDPDQTGEWLFGSSRSPRYGMSGTMRLEAPNGIRWVTRRDGPSSVPA